MKQVSVFAARKDTDAEHYSEACKGVDSGNFKGVPVLPSVGKERVINKNQFYQALADSLTFRLLDHSDKVLVDALDVLDPITIAGDLAPEFGEEEIQIICNRFILNVSEVKMSYRIFKETGGRCITPPLRRLLLYINTIPVSTAECERGFSRMNIVCNTPRSRLTVKHMASLMFVSIVGPPLRLFDPLIFVKSWLLLKRRDANGTNCKTINTTDCSNESGQLAMLWSQMV